MQTQNGLKKDVSLTKCVLGAHPIIEHFIETLRIREIIGTYLPADRRMKLDDGKVLTLLIHNILTSPNPLYEMEDWLKPLDAEKVGLRPGETAWIQDDRIGRALTKFYDSRHKDVFFRLAMRAIKVFDLDCGRIHHDTTSVTFAGKYGGWSASEQLAFGKNKDHRPDLKQRVQPALCRERVFGVEVGDGMDFPLVPTLCVGTQSRPLRGPTTQRTGNGRHRVPRAAGTQRASKSSFPRRAWERGKTRRHRLLPTRRYQTAV